MSFDLEKEMQDRRARDAQKCDCGRGHLGEHRMDCPEFPKLAAIMRRPGEPDAKERITIAKARVERKKQELDNALAEYAMACQTLAVAIERSERTSELPTEPQHEKPDQPSEG